MKKLLIVVDYQNDFVSGSLGFPEAEALEPKLHKKVQDYLDAKDDVVYTMDTHGENYMDTQEGKYLPVPHCIRNTEGWQLRPEIGEMILPEHIFDKPTFGSVDIVERIKEIAGSGEIEVELVGLCTDICVVSNALLLKAFLPETKISVDPACCAGVTPEKHEAALETMRSCQIVVEA